MAFDAGVQFNRYRFSSVILDVRTRPARGLDLFIVVIHQFFHPAQQHKQRKVPALRNHPGRQELRYK